MRPRRHSPATEGALGVAATLAFAVTPGVAAAATLTPDRACYRTTQIMELTLGGFPADSGPGFTGNGQPLRARFGADGQEEQLSPAGRIGIQAPSRDRTFTSEALHLEAIGSATDADGLPTTITAAADVRLIDAFHATSSPSRATPRSRVTYRIAGAVELTPVYLHVVRERSGRSPGRPVRRTFRLGTPTGPCGSKRAVGDLHVARGFVFSRSIDLVRGGDRDPSSSTFVNLPPLYG
jgi:hypothetical protein